jgi:hypothetical protein
MSWYDDGRVLDAEIGALPGVVPDTARAEELRRRCGEKLRRRGYVGWVGAVSGGWLRRHHFSGRVFGCLRALVSSEPYPPIPRPHRPR